MRDDVSQLADRGNHGFHLFELGSVTRRTMPVRSRDFDDRPVDAVAMHHPGHRQHVVGRAGHPVDSRSEEPRHSRICRLFFQERLRVTPSPVMPLIVPGQGHVAAPIREGEGHLQRPIEAELVRVPGKPGQTDRLAVHRDVGHLVTRGFRSLEGHENSVPGVQLDQPQAGAIGCIARIDVVLRQTDETGTIAPKRHQGAFTVREHQAGVVVGQRERAGIEGLPPITLDFWDQGQPQVRLLGIERQLKLEIRRLPGIWLPLANCRQASRPAQHPPGAVDLEPVGLALRSLQAEPAERQLDLMPFHSGTLVADAQPPIAGDLDHERVVLQAVRRLIRESR